MEQSRKAIIISHINIFAITGMPGAGKKLVRKVIEKHGIPVVVMRHAVEKEMQKKNISLTNENLRKFATELREKKGKDIVARLCIPLVDNILKKSSSVILDGIRSPDEISFFKKKYNGKFVLIAVHASPDIRFERLKKRGLKWDMKKREEFDWRDSKELSWGLGKAIAMADYTVLNEGTKEELEKNIENILKKLL
ncbi:MAG: flagellar hook-basal body complex protein FliE [Candidatus Aenigmarchaeota archaeon]|nr:flagellar hook-basal body complex protein FliE [Candidatus Aenigmarchaeota archaeon]